MRRKRPLRTKNVKTTNSVCCIPHHHSKISLLIMGIVMLFLGLLLWINMVNLVDVVALVLMVLGVKKIYWSFKA